MIGGGMRRYVEIVEDAQYVRALFRFSCGPIVLGRLDLPDDHEVEIILAPERIAVG